MHQVLTFSPNDHSVHSTSENPILLPLGKCRALLTMVQANRCMYICRSLVYACRFIMAAGASVSNRLLLPKLKTVHILLPALRLACDRCTRGRLQTPVEYILWLCCQARLVFSPDGPASHLWKILLISEYEQEDFLGRNRLTSWVDPRTFWGPHLSSNGMFVTWTWGLEDLSVVGLVHVHHV